MSEEENSVQIFSRSRTLDGIIGELQRLIEKTEDYFDDELTAQLNLTRTMLQAAMSTIQLHELRRLRLVQDMNELVKKEMHEIAQ